MRNSYELEQSESITALTQYSSIHLSSYASTLFTFLTRTHIFHVKSVPLVHWSYLPHNRFTITNRLNHTLLHLDWSYRFLTSSPSNYLTSSHLVALSTFATGYHLPQQYWPIMHFISHSSSIIIHQRTR